MSLLMDPKIIIENKLTNINKKLREIKKTDKTPGLIIIINENVLETLKNKKGKSSKLEYLDSDDFVDSIKFTTFVYFDDKVCVLEKESILHMKIVIQNTMRYLPNNLKILYPYKTESKKVLTLNGFIKYKTWMRLNDVFYKKTDFIDNSLTKINSDKICSIKIQLSKNTIKYIKELSNRGSIDIKGKIKQKELAGEMYVSKITNEHVHILDIKNLKYGQDDHVELKQSLISFHTHPTESYNKYNVTNGWPSHSDYCSFLIQGNSNSLLHFVISLEGLYILTFSKEWILNNLKYSTEIKNTIKDCKAIDKKIKKGPEWHVSEINKLKYKKVKIFNNYFFKWSSLKSFTVYMMNENNFCKILK